jgi:exodeoxyribonuclease VII small subunit
MTERTTPESSLSFEAAMSRLEAIVRDLEEGNLSLDQSIRSFEEGMVLVRRCASELRRAEERVKRLTEEAGRILVEDMTTLGPAEPGSTSDP